LRDITKNLLVIRFSSLGDLGLLYPVMVSFLKEYPEYTITLVTKASFAPLFKNIERLIIYPVDFKKDYRGLGGLFKLSRTLLKGFSFNIVIDAHQVLRTRVLGFLLGFSGKKIYHLEKFRSERRKLTRKENKVLNPVPHASERYISLFQNAGLPISLIDGPYIPGVKNFDVETLLETHPGFQNKRKIGIAPFAKWETKIWPMAKMEELIKKLSEAKNYSIFIFGAGKEEKKQIDFWGEKYADVYSGTLVEGLYNEIYFMSKLDLFLSMDSANMHLAALSGIPVLSIWGPTHSLAGFSAVHQKKENRIEISPVDLTCRPCSVFGDKPCWRGDHACMEGISVEVVFQKIEKELENNYA